MRELWTANLDRWFPRGLEDPDLALLEVRIDKAEYWDEPRNENVKIGTLAPPPGLGPASPDGPADPGALCASSACGQPFGTSRHVKRPARDARKKTTSRGSSVGMPNPACYRRDARRSDKPQGTMSPV